MEKGIICTVAFDVSHHCHIAWIASHKDGQAQSLGYHSLPSLLTLSYGPQVLATKGLSRFSLFVVLQKIVVSDRNLIFLLRKTYFNFSTANHLKNCKFSFSWEVIYTFDFFVCLFLMDRFVFRSAVLICSQTCGYWSWKLVPFFSFFHSFLLWF